MNEPGSGARTWAVIAGGGTSGHLIPGLAVAQALVARGHDPASIHFLGSRRGLEARLVPAAGFGLTELRGRGLPRRVSLDAARALAEGAAAAVEAIALLRKLRPSVVVSLGGHASFAGVMAGFVLRVPVVVMEQNAVAGRANRLAGRMARACAVSFPGTGLPRATVTGNPVRAEILAVDRSPKGRLASRSALGLGEGRRVLAVVGGSLGARRINEAMAGALASWAGRDDLAVRHVVGQRDWDRLATTESTAAGSAGDHTRADGSKNDGTHRHGLIYRPIAYEDRMDLVMAAADLVVGRAGAGTVAELAATGVPAILVPLPGAPGDHQTANAQVLERAGAAVMVADEEFDAERLVSEVDRLLSNPERLESMGRAAAVCGRRDAADAVALLVERWARQR